MKKIIFIVTACIQLFFIFFYIYTQSVIIKLTYSFQDAEHAVSSLQKQKKDLTHELLSLQEAHTLKNYASSQLGMKKIRISDIKELPHD